MRRRKVMKNRSAAVKMTKCLKSQYHNKENGLRPQIMAGHTMDNLTEVDSTSLLC